MALRCIWRIVVTVSLFTFALLAALNVVAMIAGTEQLGAWMNNAAYLVRIPLGVLGAFTAIGVIALWIGMMLDCVLYSGLSWFSRLKWLLLLVVINMLGAFIYYFKVFNKRGPVAPVVWSASRKLFFEQQSTAPNRQTGNSPAGTNQAA